MKPNILILTSRFPYPLERGDKLRIFHQIRTLSASCDIHLVSIARVKVSTHDYQTVKNYCKSIDFFYLSPFLIAGGLMSAIFSGLPLQAGFFYTKTIARKIQAVIDRENPALIYCQLLRMAEFCRYSPCPKIIDYMDAFAYGMKQRASYVSFWKKPVWNAEANRLKRYELSLFEDFDGHIAISEKDASQLNIPEGSRSDLTIVSNGVDMNEFYVKDSAEKQYDLLFTGNMFYGPNVDSAMYVIEKIMPLIRQRAKGIKLLIAGIGSPAEIKRKAGDDVIVIEKFSHIREAFWQSKILLCPVTSNIGLQNKVLQAMAVKVPCIVSEPARIALNEAGDDEILIAGNPEDFTNKIMMLLKDPSLYNTIRENAYDFVKQNNEWSMANQPLENLIEELL